MLDKPQKNPNFVIHATIWVKRDFFSIVQIGNTTGTGEKFELTTFVCNTTLVNNIY